MGGIHICSKKVIVSKRGIFIKMDMRAALFFELLLNKVEISFAALNDFYIRKR